MAIAFDISKTSTLPLVRKFPHLFRYAASVAINDVAFDAKRRLAGHAKKVFKNPKPFTINAGLVYRKATKDNLEAMIGLKDRMELPKAGTAPDVYLRRQIIGGERQHKRFERALLRRFPQFGRGTFFVPARQNKNFLDNYGQLRGGIVTQMLSQLQAFPEQGYRSNIKNPDKALYFPVFHKGDYGMLPPGIYKRDALGSENFEAVVFATRKAPRYRKRYYYFETVEKAIRITFGPSFSKRFSRMAAKQVREFNLTNQAVLRRHQVAGKIRKIQSSASSFRPGASLVLR